jgi:hypothetical protein
MAGKERTLEVSASSRPSAQRLPSWLSAGLTGLVILLLGGGLAFFLAWVSSGFLGTPDWLSFAGAIMASLAILAVGWFLMRLSESQPLPGWLAGLVLGAAVLRLAAGVIWMVALPGGGHGSPQEMAGYVMSDAYQRDQTAWKLGTSNKSLLKSFTDYHKADQYGGLLFISAAAYRYLGGAQHAPLLMVIFTAAISALAVLFTWAFARRVWDQRVANLAAWGLALYPEAILLGSSQMREAFTMPLACAAFYGLARYRQKHDWVGVAWILVPILLYLPFSPPFAALLLALLGLAALFMRPTIKLSSLVHQRWFWFLAGVLAVAAAVGVWASWKQLAPGVHNPLELVPWWIQKTAEYQVHLTKITSGWIQKIFKNTPTWTHIPFLVGYGVVRPFLPAALIVTSQSAVWPWITLWRALGWTILLAMLLYAPLHAWINKNTDRFTRILLIIAWLTILLASYRGGGDQDDNPRYRAAFIGIQIALAAWAWVEQQRAADQTFRRVLIWLGLILAWMLPWYLRREYPIYWPVVDLFKTLGLGVATAGLYTLWDWVRRQSRTGPPGDQSAS